MPKYKLQAPDGRTVTIEGDAPPDEAAMDEIFASLPAGAPAEASAGPAGSAETEAPPAPSTASTIMQRSGLAGLAELLTGAGKQARFEGQNLARLVTPPVLRGAEAEKPVLEGPEKLGALATKVAPSLALAAATGGASLPVQAAVQGAAGVGQAALEGAGPGEAAVSGALGAAAPLAGPAVAKATRGLSDKLRKTALTLYNQALHPTKEATKVTAETVLPEALKRGIRGDLKQIGSLSAEQVKTLGDQIGEAYRASTAGGRRISAKSLADSLDSLKVPFTEVTEQPRTVTSALVGPAGEAIQTEELAKEVVVLNPGAVSAIEELQGTLRKLGTKATPQQVQKYKRVVDDLVSSSNGFTRELPRGSAKEIGKTARASFKRVLDDSTPSVEKLNAEFAFWRGLKRIVKETETRKIGQQETVSLLESSMRAGRIGQVVGGVAGFGAGGGPVSTGAGVVIGDAILSKLSAFAKSPFYRTSSAVFKNATADILAGNAKALSTPAGKQVATTLALFGVQAVAEKDGEAAGEAEEATPAAP